MAAHRLTSVTFNGKELVRYDYDGYGDLTAVYGLDGKKTVRFRLPQRPNRRYRRIGTDGRYTYIYTDPDSYEPLAQVHNHTNAEGESRQQTHYFHCDQIGIPREMTDDEGNLVCFGNCTGWGRLKEETKVTDSDHQSFRLQNQYADHETGLHYNFFRYYEPDAGRFVNQDPIGLGGGSNFYQFSTNIQNMMDPWGLNAVSIAKGALSMVAIDTMTPDPTDGALPKWIAYGVLGTAPLSKPRIPLKDIQPDPIDWW